MTTIAEIDCWREFDSRGAFTLAVEVTAGSETERSLVPGGAFGEKAARERWEATVADAIGVVDDIVAPTLAGEPVTDQQAVDTRIQRTVDDSAAATIAAYGVSSAATEVGAAVMNTAAFEYLADGSLRIPEPVVNLLGGGRTGARRYGLQHVAVCPTGRTSVEEALLDARLVRDAVRDRMIDRGQEPLVDSEGSFVPEVTSPADALAIVHEGIVAAGFEPAIDDIGIAVDLAAARLYDPERDGYPVGENLFDDAELATEIKTLVEKYPIVTVEDPFRAITEAWRWLARQIPSHVDILGDEVPGTGREETISAIEDGHISAVLLKPDRYGTVTASLNAAAAITDVGGTPILSARAGDSASTVPVDLSVAVPESGVKIGSLSRFERTSKFNQLLLAERETGIEYTGSSN